MYKYGAARVPKNNTPERSIRVAINQTSSFLFLISPKFSSSQFFFVKKKTEKILDSAKHGGNYFPRTQKNVESSQSFEKAHSGVSRARRMISPLGTGLWYRTDQGSSIPGVIPRPSGWSQKALCTTRCSICPVDRGGSPSQPRSTRTRYEYELFSCRGGLLSRQKLFTAFIIRTLARSSSRPSLINNEY